MPVVKKVELKIRGNKVKVSIFDHQDTLQRNFEGNPLKEVFQKQLADLLEISHSELLQVLRDIPPDGVTIPVECKSHPYNFEIRGLHGTETYPIDRMELSEAIEKILSLTPDDLPFAEPILYIQDSRVKVLDIDYHGEYKIDETRLREMALSVRPTPCYWWISHGQGVKLVYNDQHGFTAEELASVAAYSWRLKCPHATMEIMSNTRLPQFPRFRGAITDPPRAWFQGSAIGDLNEVKKLFTSFADDVDVEEALTILNMEMGKTYPHSRCPYDPNHISKGEPVKAGSHGVYCFSCKGRGFPSFLSYRTITGKQDSRLTNCIKHHTHWTHAKYILRYLCDLPDSILRVLYTSALKLYHGIDDVRNEMVYRTQPLIRVAGEWMFDEDSRGTALTGDRKAVFKEFPCVRVAVEQPTGEKKYPIVPSKIEVLSHPKRNQSDLGYDELTLIKGAILYGVHNKYFSTIIPVEDSFPLLPADRRPRYVGSARRMKEDEFKGIINEVFPDIDWDYLNLLVFAKGLAEGNITLPYLLIAGPSGAAKTTTVDIAAGITGDTNTSVMWTSNEERLREYIRSGIQKGSYVTVNEVFKNSEKEKKTPKQALDPILNLTPNSESHALYTGSVPLGRNFVMTFTDIEVPEEVQKDKQLARRLIYHRLQDEVPDWRTNIQKFGISEAYDIRKVSRQVAAACNCYLSDLVDRVFAPGCDLRNGMEELGLSFLKDSTEFKDTSGRLKKFVEEFLKYPESNLPYRPTGKGWKSLEPNDSSEFRHQWDSFADGKFGDKWGRSRELASTSWKSLSGMPGVVVDSEVVTRNGEATVFVRFRAGEYANPAKVNQECFPELFSAIGLTTG